MIIIKMLSGTQTSTNASPSRSPSVSSDCLKRTDSSRYHSQIDTDITTRSLPTLQFIRKTFPFILISYEDEIDYLRYVALYSYRPRKADELELTKGFLYSVADKCLDGWFKGRCLATDKIGVFPGNYVQLANSETIATAHYPRSMTASIANYLSEIHGINFPVGNNQLKTSTSPRIHSQTGSLGLINNITGDVRNLNIGVACPPELPPRSLTSSNKNIGASSTGESSIQKLEISNVNYSNNANT
ncbi:Vinexin [Armadillidium vulgare]|nr:Vinexin [Armadillidium vulgare]